MPLARNSIANTNGSPVRINPSAEPAGTCLRVRSPETSTPPPPMTLRPTLLRYYRRLFRHFGPQHWWPARTRFEVILGALLTQNTSWSNVERALSNLRRRGLLSAKRLGDVNMRQLERLLRPAGYFRQKSRYVRRFVRHLNGRNGPEPSGLARLLKKPTEALRAELLSLPGVGPETADSILLYAAKRPVFVIDAYTRRVLARHKLAREEATYDDLQNLFHRHLPHDPPLFNEYHAQLVAVGKTFCHKRRPDCAACPLGPELIQPQPGLERPHARA